MDRRKTLATVGAVSLTASAAVIALGSSMGLFGLTDTSPNVGKLSPIDSSHQVSTTSTTTNTIPINPVTAPAAGHDVGDDHGVSRDGHDTNDDHGDDRVGTTATTGAVPGATDDHGDNRGPGASSRGSGSSGSGHDGDDD